VDGTKFYSVTSIDFIPINNYKSTVFIQIPFTPLIIEKTKIKRIQQKQKLKNLTIIKDMNVYDYIHY